MSATTDIGSKIKKYRKEKKYTLKNLSNRPDCLLVFFLSWKEESRRLPLIHLRMWQMFWAWR